MSEIFGLLGVDAETRRRHSEIRASISSMLIATEGALLTAKAIKLKEKHPAGAPNPFVSVANMGLARDMLNVHRMIHNSGLAEKHQERLRANLEKQVVALLEPYAREFGYTLRQVPLDDAFGKGILDRHATQMSEAKEIHARASENGVTADTLILASGINRTYELSNRIINKGVPDMQMRLVLLLDSNELVRLLERTGHIHRFEHPTHR
ncbi:MAG: hypothetical protein KGH66_00720 [Candidatus Micrarchaeota archaeon]|nr:hypothetical protein [Candidatus Micrarchaeota archaeon]